MTQTKLAKKIGISQAQISRLFAGGRNMGRRAAIKIAEVTGEDPGRLMTMPPEELKAVLAGATGAGEAAAITVAKPGVGLEASPGEENEFRGVKG